MSEDRGEWLAFLEAELARRAARIEWEAGEDNRAAQQFMASLEQMAERLVAAGPSYVPRLDDMSPAEMLACHLAPAELHPAGLPTIAEIWSEYQARKDRRL